MTITPVKNLPTKGNVPSYKNNAAFCQEFLNMNTKYAKVDFTYAEYRSVHSAYGSFRRFVAQQGYPFYVTIINGELYFVRADMED